MYSLLFRRKQVERNWRHKVRKRIRHSIWYQKLRKCMRIRAVVVLGRKTAFQRCPHPNPRPCECARLVILWQKGVKVAGGIKLLISWNWDDTILAYPGGPKAIKTAFVSGRGRQTENREMTGWEAPDLTLLLRTWSNKAMPWGIWVALES